MSNWKESYSRYKGFFLNIVELYKKRSEVKIFLELILTVVSLVIFSVFALKPTLVTIIELVKEIQAKEETIGKMDEKIKNLIAAQTNLSRERESLILLDQAMPIYPYPEQTMGQFVGLANEKQIGLESVNLGDISLKGGVSKNRSSSSDLEKLPENVNSFDITVNMNGSFESLIDTLAYIEKMRRPVKIDSVSLSKSVSEDEVQNNINFGMYARIPYLNPAESNNEK